MYQISTKLNISVSIQLIFQNCKRINVYICILYDWKLLHLAAFFLDVNFSYNVNCNTFLYEICIHCCISVALYIMALLYNSYIGLIKYIIFV